VLDDAAEFFSERHVDRIPQRCYTDDSQQKGKPVELRRPHEEIYQARDELELRAANYLLRAVNAEADLKEAVEALEQLERYTHLCRLSPPGARPAKENARSVLAKLSAADGTRRKNDN
jgi:hypothetical protein